MYFFLQVNNVVILHIFYDLVSDCFMLNYIVCYESILGYVESFYVLHFWQKEPMHSEGMHFGWIPGVQ